MGATVRHAGSGVGKHVRFTPGAAYSGKRPAAADFILETTGVLLPISAFGRLGTGDRPWVAQQPGLGSVTVVREPPVSPRAAWWWNLSPCTGSEARRTRPARRRAPPAHRGVTAAAPRSFATTASSRTRGSRADLGVQGHCPSPPGFLWVPAPDWRGEWPVRYDAAPW